MTNSSTINGRIVSDTMDRFSANQSAFGIRLKSLFFFLLATLFIWVAPAVTQGKTYIIEGVTYNIDLVNGSVSVSGYNVDLPKEATILGSITYNKKVYITTSIDSKAFQFNDILETIKIPNTITNIGSAAFYGCTALNRITIPDSVTCIEDNAFGWCTALKTVTFEDDSKVKNIGSQAFAGCFSLQMITIPDSVKTIGSAAFYSCISLVKIDFRGDRPDAGVGLFHDTANLAVVYFLEGGFGWVDGGTWQGKTTKAYKERKPEPTDPLISAEVDGDNLTLTFVGWLDGSIDGKRWYPITETSPYTVKMDKTMKLFRSSTGSNFRTPITKKIDLRMLWINDGTYMMGSLTNELGREANETQHEVTLSRDYWMGQYEVTQEQFAAVMGYNPAGDYGVGSNYPVYNVSWEEAKAFCTKLNEQEKAADRLPIGYEYTLPTEAQWEYACRAGTTTALNSGKDLETTSLCKNLAELGWYMGNSDYMSHPVGQKQPNDWGFYDMHGNVWEWCLDWYKYDYPVEAVTDPTGPESGAYRVLRGGSWVHSANFNRSAIRYYDFPYRPYSDFGFRIALTPVKE